MRFAPALVILAGCNQFYDIAPTRAVVPPDAAYFDAPTDAPFACPPTGQTPQFTRLLHQIVQNCSEYNLSTTGRAVALCSEPIYQIAEGARDELLTPVIGLEQDSQTHVDLARYVPEGDEIVVRIWQQSTVVGRIVVFRIADGVATEAYDVRLPNNEPIDSFIRFGTPSRGPLRRMIVRNSSWPQWREIEFDESGTSTLVGLYDTADLGVATLGVPANMSADGLRLVFAFNGAVYTDRATLADRFRTASTLNVPNNPVPFLTEDCSRVYFTGLGYVFWVQQQ